MIAFVVLVILLIIIYSENSSLKKENRLLRNNSQNIKNFCPYCGKALKSACVQAHLNEEKNNNKIVATTNKEEKKVIVPKENKKELNEKEIKNRFILITGAFLIVLSAILFLMSTWNTSQDYIKSLVIVFMFIVFLIASYVAKNIFNLSDTSKAFWNIAMFYIPILLFSFSWLSLFGNYLSIYGEGRYIYLLICSLAISIIYYYSSRVYKNNLIKLSSYFFQVISVIFFALVFSNNFLIIIIAIWIYLIVFQFLQKENDTFSKGILKAFFFITYAISVLTFVEKLCLDNFSFLTLILEILIFIALYLFVQRNTDYKLLYSFSYPVLYQAVFYNTVIILTSESFIIECFMLIGVITIILYELTKYHKINIETFILMLIYLPIIYVYSLVNNSSKEFIVFFTMFFVSLITFNYSNNIRKLSAYVMPISLFIAMDIFLHQLDASYYILLYFSLGIYLFASYYNNNIFIKKSFDITGRISIILSSLYLLMIESNSIYLIISLIFVYSIYLYLGTKNNNDFNKIASYVFFNIIGFIIFNYLKITDLNYMVIPFISIIIYLINSLCDRTKVKDYLIMQFICAHISLFLFNVSIVSIIINLILAIVLTRYILNSKSNVKLLSYASFIPLLYFSDTLISQEYALLFFISICLIVSLTILSYQEKEINKYTLLSFVYIFFHIVSSFDTNKYIILLLILAWCLVHYYSNIKTKDLFLCGIYLVFGAISFNFISDFGIDNYVFIKYIVLLIIILLISRTIIIKHVKEFKIFEYISLILLNLYYAFNYLNINDALLLLIIYLISIIYAYTKKIGPLLICSLVFMILVIFNLTSEFWLKISWWVYVLFFGSVLIIFAIRNELKEKKGNKKRISFKELRDKLDL